MVLGDNYKISITSEDKYRIIESNKHFCFFFKYYTILFVFDCQIGCQLCESEQSERECLFLRVLQKNKNDSRILYIKSRITKAKLIIKGYLLYCVLLIRRFQVYQPKELSDQAHPKFFRQTIYYKLLKILKRIFMIIQSSSNVLQSFGRLFDRS
ncbi:unnamed protein product [Paramecium sonneborni]|uniref:Uncharacterized protein n=1 Tax=Paramecium sonneborni TaxID=65129 RepID=A0A8S1RKD0_9CILI|nr:unnamed protein product [Paramecium sonneborni]